MANRCSKRGWRLVTGDWWLVAGGCCLAAGALFAQQPDRARTEALSRRATERLQGLQREAEHLAAQEQTLLGDLRKLDVERQIKAEQLRQVDGQYRQVAGDLASTTDRIHDLEQRDRAQRPA